MNGVDCFEFIFNWLATWFIFIAPVILKESRRDCNLLMVAVCWHREGLFGVGGQEIVSAGTCRR